MIMRRSKEKYLLKIFTVILLCFYSLSSIALSRNLLFKIHQSPFLEEVEGGREEEMMKGRVEMEINDYRQSGANPRHDPRNP
ncbi:hypothetical protein IHE45_12G054800 [Dioscorea alata]|uniref:Uncharacterized protein n=2 Tax=Dioscorea alata TaxID=55571 RepID=A0ACB7V2L6_DIOAL|nr:hypothetical protein IHE45_12G054800 [Dioscorea alata]KAH7667382.1 hypothetical protein IHE45_12G054800 [Dioscorea alata]